MLLRRSEHAGDASYEQVLQLARGALGRDAHGDRSGFVRLVQSSRRLAVRDGERNPTEVLDVPVIPGREPVAPPHSH